MEEIIPALVPIECTSCGVNFPAFERRRSSKHCRKCRTKKANEYAKKVHGISVVDRSWKNITFTPCFRRITLKEE